MILGRQATLDNWLDHILRPFAPYPKFIDQCVGAVVRRVVQIFVGRREPTGATV